MRKSPTDAGFRMFAGFIASRRFDQLRPISTIFDRQLTPLLTPALGASGSGRRWLAGADAVSAGLATSSRHERETAAERRTPSRIGHRPSRAAVDASTRRGAPVRPSAHADRTRQVGALARGTYVKGQEPARGKPWPAGPCVRGPAVRRWINLETEAQVWIDQAQWDGGGAESGERQLTELTTLNTRQAACPRQGACAPPRVTDRAPFAKIQEISRGETGGAMSAR